jgi:predicted DsbA family dithiol-disulfide isomerase
VNFPLHPETPPQGISILELFGGEAARPRLVESQRRLQQLARAEGLPLSDRSMTYNSRLAQELGSWATSAGHGRQFHDAVFHAYFVRGQNIYETAVLADLAKQAGLDSAAAVQVIATRSWKDSVDREWAACRNAGITSVPTFEAGGRIVVGAQPYEELARLVEAAGARKRPAREK